MTKVSPKNYWFRSKRFGWGWYPSAWQGWVVLLVFIGLVIGNFLRIDSVSHSVSDTLMNFIPQTIVMSLILVLICYKTGEKTRWQWGK